MLGLFKGRGKADHPLSDPKEAKRLLGLLPANDPNQALNEINDWIDSVATAEGFRPDERATLVMMLDEAGQTPARKLAREYLGNTRMPKQQESKLWAVTFEFWKQLVIAYMKCIDALIDGEKGADALKAQFPLVGVRAVRALGGQLKWLQMRYGPVHGDLWFALGRIYRNAKLRKMHQKMVGVYPGVPGESSIEHEFLKVMMFAASSPDSLVPMEIEIAERIIAYFLQHFRLTELPQPDTTYWIDLDEADPPLRLAQPPELAETLVFFSPGTAIQALTALAQNIKTRKVVPSELKLGADYEPDVVTDVLNHLAMYWAKEPPVRRHERHQVKARLSVVHGYTGLKACLSWDGSATDIAIQGQSTIESWVVQNVSAGGFGAVTPPVTGDWLRIGSLVGLQPSGGQNWLVGVIRRLSRDAAEQGNVGIQTIAKSAEAVDLRAGGSGTSLGVGILLSDPSDKMGEVRLLLDVARFDARRSIEMVKDGAGVLLMPMELIEEGDDYELARYKSMKRS